MKNKKYVVCRNDIYVGELIECNEMYETDREDYIIPGSYHSLRSILFIVDESGYADDLLYGSSKFPIVNMTDKDVCLNLGSKSKVVYNPVNMGKFLEYFEFGEQLTFSDIKDIRKKFFSNDFALHNAKLFGVKLVRTVDGRTLCENGESGVFSTADFDMLNQRGDIMVDFGVFKMKIDTFKPCKKEGPVKRLKRR